VAALLVVPHVLSPQVARRAADIIKAKPAEIFPFLNELRNWPRWTDWSRREALRFSYAGPAAGVGAVQSWNSRGMEGTMRLLQSVPG